jgi:hypothetical protein
MQYIFINDKDVKVMSKPTIFESNKPKLPCIFSKLVRCVHAANQIHAHNHQQMFSDGRGISFNLVPTLG